MFFAEVNDLNFVVRVIVADQQHINSRPNKDKFVEGFFEGGPRKNYPGIGYTRQTTPDRFIAPQPFPSWTVNPSTGKWNAPVNGPPNDGKYYIWNEQLLAWEEYQAIGN